jgi:DNA-binding response OmpR family regulator
LQKPKGIVLLVEDNRDLNRSNRRLLTLRGYAVHAVLTLADAREHLTRMEPDIILLDVMLPDGDGFDFCDEIRSKTSAHILFLTSKTEHADRIRGLVSGGDDYIVKPYHHEELLARVEAALRRRRMDKHLAQLLTKGALTLDIVANQAFIDDTDLLLTQKEFSLLLVLVQNEGTTLDMDSLYEKVWGRPMLGDKNTLQVTISKLRRKIGPAGFDITASRNKGYLFERS